MFWWNEDEIVSSVSYSNLITIYLSLFFINVRGGSRGEGREGGLKLFIFFKNVILSGPCPVVSQEGKLQTPLQQQETQTNLFIYQTLPRDTGGILGLWSSFLKYFWFIWVKNEMNQSKYWQEKVADSNFTNEKVSLFGAWISGLQFVSRSRVKIFIFRSGAGNDKSCLVTFLIVSLIRILFRINYDPTWTNLNQSQTICFGK